MKTSFAATLTSINRYIFILGLSLPVFAVLVSPATPASAASRAFDAACSFLSSTRLQCNFPALTPNFNSEIRYVTAQCNSTGVAYNFQQLQILAMPPNGGASPVAYQVAGNRGSVSGVANAAAIVAIPVQLNTSPSALIDLAPAPTGTTNCTASISATF